MALDEIPIVGSPSSLWPLAFGAVGALAIGAIVFTQLSSARLQAEQGYTSANMTARTSLIEEPAEPRRILYPEPPMEETEGDYDAGIDLEEGVSDPVERAAPDTLETDWLRAPVLVFDQSQASGPDQEEASDANSGAALDPRSVSSSMTGAANAGAQMSADERFASRLGLDSDAREIKATHLGDLSYTVIQGEVIPAVLDTALNSDLPGYARGTVTRDVRGFDGLKILVPRGSRLIGQYRSGVALGQSRAFLIWTRLIRPDGATITLAAPATDGLGRGGLTGDVDNHFFERFGNGILLSLLNIGGNAITDSGDTNIVIASGQSGRDGPGVAPGFGTNIGPTVSVPQGTPVRVFVNQDLDFSAVGAAQTSRSQD